MENNQPDLDDMSTDELRNKVEELETKISEKIGGAQAQNAQPPILRVKVSMKELQSKLKETNDSGAENADTQKTPEEDEIIELEGKGSKVERKLKNRASASTADLPGVEA